MALLTFAMLALLAATLRELEVSTTVASAVVACVGPMVQGPYSMARPMSFGAVALCAALYLCTRTCAQYGQSCTINADCCNGIPCSAGDGSGNPCNGQSGCSCYQILP
jgi:hypothetical protein